MTNAPTLTRALGGKWRGHYGTAPCPACQPERRRDQNALSLRDGHTALVLTCYKLGCDFRDILKAAGVAPGAFTPPDPTKIARREAQNQAEANKRARQAEGLWRESVPVAGTPAERYLRGPRAITCPLPRTLRFHPAVWHGPTARSYPSMVALVEGSDGRSVHRTYLRPDGSGKADIEPNKMMLGSTAGGAVRLTDGPWPLVVAEGIETALSLACGLVDGPMMLWAALSTSGLRGLGLPGQVGQLIVAADPDPAGREAADALAERAYALGWTVSHLTPLEGGDFNDILTRKAVAK